MSKTPAISNSSDNPKMPENKNFQGTSHDDSVILDKESNRQARSRSLRLLKSLITPHKGMIVLNLTFIILAQTANVIVPSFLAYGMNEGYPAAKHDNWIPITSAAIMMAFVLIIYATTNYLSIIFTSRITQNVSLDLRSRIFKHAQKLSLRFHRNYTSGKIIARQTNDLDSVNELFKSGIEQIISQVLFLTITLMVVFCIDWRSGLIILASLIPVTILIRWYHTRSQIAHRRSSVISAQFISHFIESISGISTIKLFRQEQPDSQENETLVQKYKEAIIQSLGLFGVLGPGLMLLGGITTGTVLFFAGLQVLDRTMMIGTIVALVLYVSRFYRPIIELAMFYNTFQSATASLEKISGFLEEPYDIEDPAIPVDSVPSQNKGRITFESVDFRYSTDRQQALKPLDLEITPGQNVAIVGKTGAGKSTFAKLLTRFYDPDSGTISVDGQSLDTFADSDLRQIIGMITQEPFIFSGTIAENIALGNPEATHQQIIQAAQAVGANEFIEQLPEGYSTDINKHGAALSAGQKQLISFARIFLTDPKILILDEATSSLDLPSETMIQEALKNISHNRTSVIIAHRLATIMSADRILVMDNGQIIEDGTIDELIQKNGHFTELYNSWQRTLN